MPATARQTVPAAILLSAPQGAVVPSQVSATSQAPAEARQILPAGAAWPMQRPDKQRSSSVQTLLSSQSVESGAIGFEQTPVAGLQTPATWHWSSAAQVTGLEPTHTPFWQVST